MPRSLKVESCHDSCRIIVNKKNRLYSIMLFITVIVCYLNSLGCGFVFDDMSAIVDNKDLRPKTPLLNLFQNDFWGTPMKMEKSHKSYRPLCVLTFRLNYLISELEPISYHLVNILLHGVVCILFLRVCSMFLREIPSFLAAMMFAVHPVHVEAVTGVVGRAELLSAIFSFFSLMMYSKSIKVGGQTDWPSLISSVLFVLVSMLCKEQGITVIGICCVYEVFCAQKVEFWECLNILTSFIKGKPRIPRWLKQSFVRAGFLVGSTVFLLFLRIQVMGAQLPVFTNFDNPASVSSTPTRQLTFNYLLPINAWLLLCPSQLLCDWTMGTLPLVESILDYRNIFTLSFYAMLFALTSVSLREQGSRNRGIVMGLAFLVLPFIPATNLFFPVGFVVAERILYSPSMGFCIIFAVGYEVVTEHKQKMKILINVLVGILLVTQGFKTIRRNNDWKTEYTLFRSALKVTQTNAKVWNNIGHALEKTANWTDALHYFRHAASVQPDDIGAHINVGRTYNNLNMSKEAEEAYRKALDLFPPIKPGKSYTARIAPSHLNVFLNLANLVSKDPNRLEEASGYLQQAVNMRPDYIQGYINRGDLLIKLGRPKEALQSYETALRYEYDNPDILYNLGVVHLTEGNHNVALNYFEKALGFNPEHERTLFNSALLIQEMGDPRYRTEAKKRLTKLLDLKPDDPKVVYFNLALLATDEKDFTGAESNFIKAIEIDDGFRGALFNLALLYVNDLQRPLDAVPYLEKLLGYDPEHTKGLILMGDINVNHLKNLDAAEKNFKSILKREPDNVQANHNLCVVFVEKGDLVTAEKCLTHVLNLAPKEQYIRNHLNIVRSRLLQAQKQQQQKEAAAAAAASKQKQAVPKATTPKPTPQPTAPKVPPIPNKEDKPNVVQQPVKKMQASEPTKKEQLNVGQQPVIKPQESGPVKQEEILQAVPVDSHKQDESEEQPIPVRPQEMGDE